MTRIEIFMLFTTSLIVKSMEIFALVREIALSDYNFKRFSERQELLLKKSECVKKLEKAITIR